MNKTIMRAMGFGQAVDNIEKGLCADCGQKPGPFRDAVSVVEHKISGLCQACQDKHFVDPDGPLDEAERERLALQDAESESLETLEAGSEILDRTGR